MRPPDLSVVIPAFNEQAKIGDTIRWTLRGLARAPFRAEIIVVDDGSTDGTAEVAKGTEAPLPVTVLSQPNRGKFAARLAGIEASRGEFVLLLDAGAELLEDSLTFLAQRLEAEPSASVWNGHTIMETEGGPFEQFWDVVTGIAFSAYTDNPRTTSFGTEDFDLFPKGTTCFFAPRELLLEACAAFTTYYDDVRHASDDTAVIRWIAERQRINISPSFAYIYRFGEDLPGFVHHAYHRGIHFLDGHGHRESRFLPLVLAFYPLSLLSVVLTFRRPRAAPFLVAGLAGSVSMFALLRGRRGAEVVAVGALAPVYAVAHGAGMWRGLALAAGARLRRARR